MLLTTLTTVMFSSTRSFVSLLAIALSLTLLLPETANGLPFEQPSRYNMAPTVSTIYQFPNNGSWLENLVVRPNGKILATRLDVPEVWSFSPSTKEAILLYSVPNVTSCLGITEVYPDVYAVAAATIDLKALAVTPGSFVIWKLDLAKETPEFSLIVQMAEAELLNGLTTFNDAGLILLADSFKGVIWRLDVNTKAYSVALSGPEVARPDGQSLGVNGVKYDGKYVYFSNSGALTVVRVLVDGQASATSPYEIVNSGLFIDDLVLRPDGGAYLAGNPENQVYALNPQHQVSVLAGNLNSTLVAGVTALQFSRDKRVLYASTCGGLSKPVDGDTVEPAKIAAIDLKEWAEWTR